MSQFRRQKKYTQKYRAKWQHMDEFSGWLNPLPNDTTKAYCSVCNVVIKAHLCDLKKHGAAKKHINAEKLVQTLQTFSSKDEDGTYEYKSKEHYELQDMDEEEDDNDEEESDEEDSNHRWPASASESLIKHVKTYWKDLKDGLRKKKDIWEDVAAAVNADGYYTDSQECNKKFRNMKMTYCKVMKKSLTDEVINYRIDYFDDLHELLENDPETISLLEQKKVNLKSEVMDGEISDEETIIMEESEIDEKREPKWSETTLHMMLDFLQEFQGFFSGKEGENEEEVWQNVTEQLNLKGFAVNEDHCKKKWQSMVREYHQHKSLVVSEGPSAPSRPYFSRVRHIIRNVKIPTGSSPEKRAIRIRLKSGRTRGRKRKLPELPEESDASEPESRSPYSRTSSSRRRYDDEETLRSMRRLTETAALWNRMDTIEMRLDDISDHYDTQRQTNNLLRQILTELSILSDSMSPSQSDPLNDREGITLVVPEEQSL